MTHPLFEQLRFTRSEWRRALNGLTADEGIKRFEPMNCISWIVGHLAWQEQAYWFYRRGQPRPVPAIDELVGYGRPASTPPLADMLTAWQVISTSADPYLDSLVEADLTQFHERDGQRSREDIGTMALRMIYHYWFHMGEIMAIRQMLGHTDLPQFVGGIGREAPYRGS